MIISWLHLPQSLRTQLEGQQRMTGEQMPKRISDAWARVAIKDVVDRSATLVRVCLLVVNEGTCLYHLQLLFWYPPRTSACMNPRAPFPVVPFSSSDRVLLSISTKHVTDAMHATGTMNVWCSRILASVVLKARQKR